MATAQAFAGSSSSTPSNTPSNTEINSIIPGTIFPDDSSLPSFIDSDEISYGSPNLPPSSSSPPSHTTNKSGGVSGGGSNGAEAGGGGGGGGGGGDHIGQIEVNSTIQTILVVLGFGIVALFLLGVVATYYITHKNRRAEEKKKRREEESAGGAKAGRSSTTLPLSTTSSSSLLMLPSHPNISAGTGTAAAAAAVGRENPAHRIIITRSMTATTANTRVGTGGPNDEKDHGGGSGGLSPIGDGKSDMVTIYIDEMPDDDETRARHHCDDDGDDGCREKQELDEKEEENEETLSQERNQKPLDTYPSAHNSL